MEKQEHKRTNYIPSEILHFILFREKKITFYSYFIHFISVINDTWSVARPKNGQNYWVFTSITCFAAIKYLYYISDAFTVVRNMTVITAI